MKHVNVNLWTVKQVADEANMAKQTIMYHIHKNPNFKNKNGYEDSFIKVVKKNKQNIILVKPQGKRYFESIAKSSNKRGRKTSSAGVTKAELASNYSSVNNALHMRLVEVSGLSRQLKSANSQVSNMSTLLSNQQRIKINDQKLAIASKEAKALPFNSERALPSGRANFNTDTNASSYSSEKSSMTSVIASLKSVANSSRAKASEYYEHTGMFYKLTHRKH